MKEKGFKVDFRASSDNEPPKMKLGVIGTRAIGNFENWGRGDTDYTIMAPPSPKARMVCHRWMLILTDETFESTFEEFMTNFRHFEFGKDGK